MDLEFPMHFELPMDFRISLDKSLHLAQGNLQGVISHPKAVDEYFKDELTWTEYNIMGLIQDAKFPRCRAAGLKLPQSITSQISDLLS